MLAGFLFGECVQPVYWQQSVATATWCGQRNGYLYAVLASLMGLAILLGHKWKGSWSTQTPSAFPMLELFVGFLVTVWMVLPLVFRRSATEQWSGYQAAVQQLMSQYGMSQLAAISTVSSWRTGELDTGGSTAISGAALLGAAHPDQASGTQVKLH